MTLDGRSGWDAYAAYYDWENARTMARRDVPFWRRLARAATGPVLELGCGTGRVTAPLARGGTIVTGVDYSPAMLARARARLRRGRLLDGVRLVRADIRALPFTDARFALVMAPYGILQSLLGDRDLAATLHAVARVLAPGGQLAIDLVPDLPGWREYRNETRLRGWRPGRRGHVTLVESVRQDRARRLTIFEQEFVERRGAARSIRRFELAFRTVSLPGMARRLERAGLRVTARLGDYDGGPWTRESEAWILMAERPGPSGALRRPGAAVW